MLDYRIIHITAVLSVFQPAFSEDSRHHQNDPNCISNIKDRNLTIHKITAETDSGEISCSSLKDDEDNIHISLYNETSKLHATEFRRNQKVNDSEPKPRFHVSVENNTIRYVINTPAVNDTGLYSCVVQNGLTGKNPPRKTYTLLLVKDSLWSCSHEGWPVSWLILTAGCALFTLYNIIVTVLTCCFGWKHKHEDTEQSDYYNTRPGEFRSYVRSESSSRSHFLPTCTHL